MKVPSKASGVTEKEFRVWLGHLMLAVVYVLNGLKVSKREIYIHEDAMIEVVDRFLRDYRRLHLFHGSRGLSPENRAGYIAYWFSRLKPIQLVCPSRAPLNDFVAALIGLSTVNVPDAAIDDNLSELVYGLRYRNLTAPALSMIFRLMEGKRTVSCSARS